MAMKKEVERDSQTNPLNPWKEPLPQHRVPPSPSFEKPTLNPESSTLQLKPQTLNPKCLTLKP